MARGAEDKCYEKDGGGWGSLTIHSFSGASTFPFFPVLILVLVLVLIHLSFHPPSILHPPSSMVHHSWECHESEFHSHTLPFLLIIQGILPMNPKSRSKPSRSNDEVLPPQFQTRPLSPMYARLCLLFDKLSTGVALPTRSVVFRWDLESMYITDWEEALEELTRRGSSYGWHYAKLTSRWQFLGIDLIWSFDSRRKKKPTADGRMTTEVDGVVWFVWHQHQRRKQEKC